LITEEKLNYISPVTHNPDEHDIFTLIRELFLSGIQFANEHPRYIAISKKLLANQEAPIFKAVKADTWPYSFALFETLLENAIARGEVRADLDIKMFGYLITSLNAVVIEYYSEFVSQTVDESMIETVDKFIDFLKNGIGANS
jgi:hypothetical protein